MQSSDVVIAGAGRTAVGAFSGAFGSIPAHDLGAAVCAGLVFAAGAAVITVRGARDLAGEQA